MKRRTSQEKRRTELRASKEKGMTNPSGMSKYATKRKTGVGGINKNRPSWFVRYHIDRHAHH
jgi:hypothetical protein